MALSYDAYTNARLHDLRKKQGKFAAAIGYDRSYISRAINNHRAFKNVRSRIGAQLDA